MRALRVTGAAALLVAAAVHVAQLISIFHAVPWIGPLFAIDAVVSTLIAGALLGRHWRVAAIGGAAVSAAALAGLAWSSTIGLFGWQEVVLRPSVKLAIASELVAFAALAPLALPAPAVRSRLAVRSAFAAGLIAIAVLHIAASGEEWDDTRGLFWLFMALAAACLALAVRLASGLDRWSRSAVFGLASAALVGYVLSRTTGLPGATDDIGDWADPLGIAALAVEVVLIGVVAGSGRRASRRQDRPFARPAAPAGLARLPGR